MTDIDRIELRSEKVRNIIGKVPPIIVRSGIGVLSIVFVLFMAAMYCIPFLETITVKTELISTDNDNEQQPRSMLPYKLVSQIDNTTSAKIEFEGYDSKQFGTANALVSNVDKNPININGINYFVVDLVIIECPSDIQLNKGMKGRVTFLLSDRTIMEKIFKGLAR